MKMRSMVYCSHDTILWSLVPQFSKALAWKQFRVNCKIKTGKWATDSVRQKSFEQPTIPKQPLKFHEMRAIPKFPWLFHTCQSGNFPISFPYQCQEFQTLLKALLLISPVFVCYCLKKANCPWSDGYKSIRSRGFSISVNSCWGVFNATHTVPNWAGYQ